VIIGMKVAWPYVFRGTVADNLRLADPTASDDRLRSPFAARPLTA
jgi:ABC-type transport system involved in cytochrome bd biosynthesis fused ATPase/permease subunit